MTIRALTFFVPGRARPGGSKRAFVIKKTMRAVIVDAGGQHTKDWRATVALAAHEAAKKEGWAIASGPVEVIVSFCFTRPKSHYGTGRNAARRKPGAPTHHTQAPDATKLWRAAEDAMTGIVWKDDSQVTKQSIEKRWAVADAPAGMDISIWTEGDSDAPTSTE